MKPTLTEKAVQELVEKLMDNGCDVSVNGEITALSVKHWAENTSENEEDFLSIGEDPVFTQAELLALVRLSNEVAAYINNPPPIVVIVDVHVRLKVSMPAGDSSAQARVANTVLENVNYDFSYDDTIERVKIVDTNIVNWTRRSEVTI